MLSFFVIQAAIGGAVVLSQIHLVWRGLHLAMGAATWARRSCWCAGGTIATNTAGGFAPSRSVSSNRSAGGAPAVSESPMTRKQIIGAYVKLSKPWIIVLLLVTTFAAMLIAPAGSAAAAAGVLHPVGRALSAAGASAINSYIDRDIDGFMSRTKNRPVVTRRIAPDNALAYGIAAGVRRSSFWLWRRFAGGRCCR